MNEMNICGVLIHARPQHTAAVKKILVNMAGVEVHEVTAAGRMIVTIEGNTRAYVADTLHAVNKVEGVLAANMVYQYSDVLVASEQGIPA